MIADLWAKLSLRPDKGSFDKGHKSLASIKGLLVGVGAYFGAGILGKALIGFNANVEETKNQIAGMLALTKKTDLADQLSNADMLFEHLQKRAAVLPGTTEEYTRMLGMLTQPLTAAGASLQDLEDLTVDAVVASKALGISWEVGARDIDQALRGTFRSVDVLTGKLLAPMGFVGEEGRRKFNQLSKERRLAVIKEALQQKQIAQLGEAQGKSFKGVLSTLQDAWQRFMGAIGKPLFEALGKQIQKLNGWIAQNQERLAAVAATIGDVLLGAFEAVVAMVQYFMENGDEFLAILIAIGSVITGFAVAWAISFAPIIAIIALIATVAFLIIKLVRNWDLIKRKAGEAWDWIKKKASDAWEFIKDIPDKLLQGFEALGNGIINALSEAFNWVIAEATKLPGEIWSAIKDIPVIGRIASAAEGLANPSAGVVGNIVPERPAAEASAANMTNVTMGDINVTAPLGSDPKAFGEAIRPHVRTMLDSEFRRAAD